MKDKTRGCALCKNYGKCIHAEKVEAMQHDFPCMDERFFPQDGWKRAILALIGCDLFLLGAIIYKYVLWQWI